MRPRFIAFLVVLALIGVGTLLIMWTTPIDRETIVADPQPAAPAAPTAPRPAPASGHRDEAHWLVDLVLAEMVKWAVLSGGPAEAKAMPSDDGCIAYRVAAAGCNLRLADHIWSASDYLPVAHKLLAKAPASADLAPGGTTSDDGEDLATALLQPTTAVMLKRDQILSQQLADSPADPGLHEQAALLCATMAFREAAGRFCDPRRELCAATAHLALASARARPAGICGLIAKAIIESLANREAAALAAADALPGDGQLAAWKRAVRLRTLGDWKTQQVASDAPMIERLAYCRVLINRLGDAAAATWLTKEPPPAAPDWGRLMCEFWLSVDNGHAYAKDGFSEEIKELELLWQHINHRRLTESDLPAALVLSDSPGKPPQVLGITRWSAFLDRHRAHRLVAAHDFFDKSWGVPEATAQVRQLCAGPLAVSPLTSFMRMQFSGDPQRNACALMVADAAQRDPGLLSDWLWGYLQGEPTLAVAKARLPNARDWFVTMSPPGTAHHAGIRTTLVGGSRATLLMQIEASARLAPHDSAVMRTLVQWRGTGDVAALATTFGGLLELDSGLAWEVAKQATALDDLIPAYRRLMGMDAKWAVRFGQVLVDAKRYPEAVEAYERAFKDDTNRVHVANTMGWLVTWYADHDNLPRAKEIATHGYEVFSYAGIEIKALLDERTGELDAAEKAWRGILERYEDEGPLLTFWQRTAATRPASRDAFSSRIGKLFPGGQKPVRLTELRGAPSNGVVVTSESPLSLKHGVRRGQVIVAIDDVACETMAQYLFLRTLDSGKPLDIILWDGATYRRVVAEVPKRRLQCDIEDWIAAKIIQP